MKLAVMQPYFFPYIGYFQCIAAVDKYILYEHLNYITEGWMHRNRILVKHKGPAYINATISGKSSNKKISEIRLESSLIWKKKLLNTLARNYKGSEYYEQIFPLIEELINRRHDLLFEYNADIIKAICSFLEISTEIVSHNPNYLPLEEKLSHLEQHDHSQFEALQPTKPAKKVVRALEICRNEKADVFLNAIGGRELYAKDDFKQYGIDLLFVQTKSITYQQFAETFYPDLSIIDVLMHNGKERTKRFLQHYDLV